MLLQHACDRACSCRPDVGVLVYPVITMLAIDPESGRPLTHEGSRDGVVGLPAEKEAGQQARAKSLLEWYSLERQVTNKVRGGSEALPLQTHW